MGATFSLNRKDLFYECSAWNVKARESVRSFQWKCSHPAAGENTAKENKTPTKPVDSVAAYLHKCASAGKKKIRGKIEPVQPANKSKDDRQEVETIRHRQMKIVLVSKPEDSKQRAQTTRTLGEPASTLSSFTITTDVLRCLGNFVKNNYCENLTRLRPSEVVLWLRGVDRALLLQGWQDHAFLTPPNLVFLFLLLKEYLATNIVSTAQLRAELLTCLYMAYTYSGPEISYPLKPFLVDGDRVAFWDRCMFIINNLSEKMLKVNREPKYFAELLVELKNYGVVSDRRDG